MVLYVLKYILFKQFVKIYLKMLKEQFKFFILFLRVIIIFGILVRFFYNKDQIRWFYVGLRGGSDFDRCFWVYFDKISIGFLGVIYVVFENFVFILLECVQKYRLGLFFFCGLIWNYFIWFLLWGNLIEILRVVIIFGSGVKDLDCFFSIFR